MNKELKTEIKYLKGVGPKKAKLLGKLGIFTINDLFLHLPTSYIKRNKVQKIADLEMNQNVSIILTVADIKVRHIKRGLKLLDVVFTDGVDFLIGKWFNFSYWILEKLKIEQKVWISGHITARVGLRQIVHPQIEILSKVKEDFWKTRSILPVYPSTKDLPMSTFRSIIYNGFKFFGQFIKETLPPNILKKYNFPTLKQSFRNVHFPAEGKPISRARFVFEELFYHQIMFAKSKRKRISKKSGIVFRNNNIYTNILKKNLPFELTNAQKKVIKEIFSDMNSSYQMNRFLQGDVGSGKTIVILFAILLAVANGYQTAILVPTEILSSQHYLTIDKFLPKGINLAQLGGGKSKSKDKIKKLLKDGEIGIIVGTHALLEDDIVFKNLGLVIIDEQHRFGVNQRKNLIKKGVNVDIITLSATPIPRSLAISLYGDMEISIINELPKERKLITTVLKKSTNLQQIYEALPNLIKKGNQIYVVCPLVKESEKLDLLDALNLYKKLKNKIFTNYKVELVHGKISLKEKNEIMKRFSSGKIDILVSTTVIEVGIDVPQANVMIIHHAERFGLSTLHQLRGRIGRGKEKSWCILVYYPPITQDAKLRLSVMEATCDGFEIAEKDLKLRGMGDIFGTKQSGIPAFKFANIVLDQDILKAARNEAFSIIEDDQNLKKPKNEIIKKNYNRFYSKKEELMKF